MAYKVLRLMEYTYPDVETAEEDMRHWTVSGAAQFGDKIIRSSIIQYPEKEQS